MHGPVSRGKPSHGTHSSSFKKTMAMSNSETNGNIIGDRRGALHSTLTSSTEDLSEYTDADESISAPTEFLAEFLSAVMLKDYETALKYCKLILHYEPNNATAKEFYPLIVEKLQMMQDEDESDEESSSDMSEASSASSDLHGSSSSDEGEMKPDSDATTASYSSLEDEEADRENNAISFGSHQFSETDITNGNTGGKPKLLTSPRRNPSNSLTGTLKKEKNRSETKKNITEEIRKNLNQTQNNKLSSSSDSTKNSSSSSSKKKKSVHLSLVETSNKRNISPKRKAGKTISPEIFHSSAGSFRGSNTEFPHIQFQTSSDRNWPSPSMESPESEFSELGYSASFPITSSDSESPTDPTTQPTIQEYKNKTVGSVI